MDFERGEFLGQPALINEEGQSFRFMDDEHISFGDVCRKLIGEQAQYASRYINPSYAERFPYLANELRLTGEPNDYHRIGIHPDDVDEFVLRYNIALAYETGTMRENGQHRQLSEQELQEMHGYLNSIGAFSPPSTTA